MKVLGIDYGTKRIGVALSDEGGVVAFPRAVMVNVPGVIEAIVALARAEGVLGVVIGESRRADGSENVLQREIVRFKNMITNALPVVPVFFQHEGMSTHGARAMPHVRRGMLSRVRRARGARQRARESVDARAAAVILQRFLDAQSRGLRTS